MPTFKTTVGPTGVVQTDNSPRLSIEVPTNISSSIDFANATVLNLTGGIDFRQSAFLENVGPFEGFGGGYLEVSGGTNVFPLTSTWYTNPTKTQKIQEKIITRNAQRLPTTVIYRLYATDGTTVLRTFTDTITYSGVFVTSRTRVQS